jgi:CubicO group peptidase (beta-lactamase class C family)
VSRTVSLPRRQETPRPAWLSGLLEELVISGRVSAAAALVGDGRGEVAAGVVGEADAQRGRPLFDLASLSKLWTASLALRLDARGLLPLGLEIGELWSGCDRRLARRTLEDLLRHRAGFVPWTPLYRRCRRRSTAIRLLVEGSLLGARRGTYSDLDYMLWAAARAADGAARSRPRPTACRRDVLGALPPGQRA